MAEYITSQEFVKLCGITERTLKSWRQLGMPGKIYKKKLQLFPEPVYHWLIETGRVDIAAKLEPMVKKKPAVTAVVVSESTTKNNTMLEDIPQSLEDVSGGMNIFQVYSYIGKLLLVVKKKMDEDNFAQTAVLVKNSQELGELLRKLEVSCIEVDKHLKNVIEVSIAEKFINNILIKVKTDIRALPYSVADRLAEMNDPSVIADFLREKIDDALRHASDVIKLVEQ